MDTNSGWSILKSLDVCVRACVRACMRVCACVRVCLCWFVGLLLMGTVLVLLYWGCAHMCTIMYVSAHELSGKLHASTVIHTRGRASFFAKNIRTCHLVMLCLLL